MPQLTIGPKACADECSSHESVAAKLTVSQILHHGGILFDMSRDSEARAVARMRRRCVPDASFMAAVINMDEPAHQECYSYFREVHHSDTVLWVVPTLLFFEMQALRARRHREGRDPLPLYGNIPLYESNTEIYDVGVPFLRKVWELDLYRKLNTLKGADLLYACIARIEGIPLVTVDGDFQRHLDLLTIVDPRIQGDAT